MVKKLSSRNSLIAAFAGVSLIIVAEYGARRFVAPLLPTLAAAQVNDMLAFILCYSPLVWFSVSPTQRNLRSVCQIIRTILARVKTWLPWVGAIAILTTISLLAPLDQWLWGQIQLPAWQSPALGLLLFPQLAPVLVVITLLLVNGIFVPLVEEWLWRGLIQPRFVGRLGLSFGVLLAAFLFSLKHMIVDASLGRLLTLTGFGIIVGTIAHREGWQSAALAHVVVNSIASIIALLASMQISLRASADLVRWIPKSGF
ncbi:MAG: CPBP family intramembrane metalloprotease [Desertifilum sp. SIO1I2]|nr:CPBP family intramembrane metalloprotease [Desertifilum sp. SIO1I2]